MKNPWDINRITWGDPFADGDEEALAKMGRLLCQDNYKFDSLMKCTNLQSLVDSIPLDSSFYPCCLNKFRDSISVKEVVLDFYTLPEPYNGDINSPVYCLNMNPGEADPLFVNDPNFLLISLFNLNHLLKHSIWNNSYFKNYKKYDVSIADKRRHYGCGWYEKITNQLGKSPKLFFIEYFPYHSSRGFVFPSWLPSYEYSNALIEDAMDKGKFIVVMRQKNRWFQRIPRLKSYKHLAYLECEQGGCLSQHNVIYKSNAYNDLVAALR